MSNPIAVPGTNVPIGALVSPSGGSGLQGLQGPQGPAGGTGGSVYTASQSVLLTGTNFTLAGDVATPANSQYYGYLGGARGWFTPPGASYTGTNSVLLTGTNFTLFNDVATPSTGACYGYRNGARGWFRPDFINVLDFGADPTGASDSTTAITNAVSGGGCVYFPAGVYKISSTITLSNATTLLGDATSMTNSTGASVITTTAATGDMFSATGPNIRFKSLRLVSSVTRTAGSCINSSNGYFVAEDCYFDSYFIGITTSSVSPRIMCCAFLNGVVNTCVGIVVNGSYDFLCHGCIISRSSGNNSAGIQILSTGDATISDCSILRGGNCILITGGASIWVHNTKCDTSTSGISILPSGSSGSVSRTKIDGCWCSSHSGNGIALANSGGSVIVGVDIIGCHLFGNGSTAILLADQYCTGVHIHGCNIAGNTTGISFGSAFTGNLMITGCKVGSGSGFGVNTTGVGGNTSGTQILIVGNDFQGNTTNTVNLPASGATVLVTNNLT